MIGEKDSGHEVSAVLGQPDCRDLILDAKWQSPHYLCALRLDGGCEEEGVSCQHVQEEDVAGS